MPYIKKEDRKKFEKAEILGLSADNAGELNYCITMICLGYLNKRGIVRYQDYNDVLGVLDVISKELYRRQISKYEDKKIKENGDIF